MVVAGSGPGALAGALAGAPGLDKDERGLDALTVDLRPVQVLVGRLGVIAGAVLDAVLVEGAIKPDRQPS